MKRLYYFFKYFIEIFKTYRNNRWRYNWRHWIRYAWDGAKAVIIKEEFNEVMHDSEVFNVIPSEEEIEAVDSVSVNMGRADVADYVNAWRDNKPSLHYQEDGTLIGR